VIETVTTSRGYDLHELLSALQKCIRRNLEYEALFFAVELEEFNPTALWNRLKVIASEDVGFAYPLMPILIETLHKEYIERKEKIDDNGSRLLFLSNAVVCLCRSPKSRITDDLLNVVLLERQNGKRLEIPDFALDMHTLRGKDKGRGWKEFFEEGSKLENEAFPNPYRERHQKLRERR
jgi:replication-associated recombination protein RarA